MLKKAMIHIEIKKPFESLTAGRCRLETRRMYHSSEARSLKLFNFAILKAIPMEDQTKMMTILDDKYKT